MSKAADIIRKCLSKNGISQRELAARMGEDVRHLNQQLNRQQDLKFGRLESVLDHLGYGLEIVQKNYSQVTPEYGRHILESGEPKGKFWYQEGAVYVGIDNTCDKPVSSDFTNPVNLAMWLDDLEYDSLLPE